jgi:hypothetical protein
MPVCHLLLKITTKTARTTLKAIPATKKQCREKGPVSGSIPVDKLKAEPYAKYGSAFNSPLRLIPTFLFLAG